MNLNITTCLSVLSEFCAVAALYEIVMAAIVNVKQISRFFIEVVLMINNAPTYKKAEAERNKIFQLPLN